MRLQVAGYLHESTQNGDGLRNVVFVSGCHNNCLGCHNKELQDPSYGESVEVSEVFNQLTGENFDLIDGITISGGEPFEQSEAVLELVNYLVERNINIWIYSGNTLDELKSRGDKHIMSILEKVDVLVDGPYIAGIAPNKRYVGSGNQIIHRFRSDIDG